MISRVAVGGEGQPPHIPIKTYNEQLEIKVRKLVAEHVEPGEGSDELVFAILDIMKLYEKK